MLPAYQILRQFQAKKIEDQNVRWLVFLFDETHQTVKSVFLRRFNGEVKPKGQSKKLDLNAVLFPPRRT